MPKTADKPDLVKQKLTPGKSLKPEKPCQCEPSWQAENSEMKAQPAPPQEPWVHGLRFVHKGSVRAL